MVRWLRIFWICLPAAIWFSLHAYLHGSGDVTLLYAYSFLPLLGFIGYMIPRIEKICRWIVLCLLFFFSAILVIEVLMMPYKAYNLWFDLLDHGSSRGRVSQLFIKLGGLIGGFGAWYMLRKEKMDIALIYLPGFFLFLLFPSVYTGILALGLYLWPQLHKKSGWRLPLLATGALLIGLTGIKGEAKGIALIDNQPGTMYNRILERYPELPLIYQVPLYGQTLTERVEDGAKPVLTTQNILKINGPAQTWVYLRTNLYRSFKGNGTLAKMDNAITRQNLERLEERPNGTMIKVTLLSDFMNIFPLTLKTSAIEAGQTSYKWDSSTASLVWSDPPLVYEEEFILYEDQNRQWLEKEEDLALYQALPSGISDRFKRLAEGFSRDTEKETVRAIQEYLLHHFSYTLDTSAQDDYVEYFLFESQKGYCLHFSTAFLMMARMNDIPCRMAEGYISYLPGMDAIQHGGTPGEALVTGFSAHTWPEVYYKDQGWTRVEVTPPYYNEETTPLGTPAAQEEMTSGKGIDWNRNRTWEWNIPNPVKYGILGILIVAAVIVLYRKRPKSRERTIKKLIRISVRKGWPHPEQSGWKMWLKVLEEKTDSSTAQEWGDLLLRFRYSPKHVENKDWHKIHSMPAKFRKKA